MKNFRAFVLFSAFLVTVLSSCTTRIYHIKSMPPGHAKKIAGSKSAAKHAPGHNKHHKR